MGDEHDVVKYKVELIIVFICISEDEEKRFIEVTKFQGLSVSIFVLSLMFNLFSRCNGGKVGGWMAGWDH